LRVGLSYDLLRLSSCSVICNFTTQCRDLYRKIWILYPPKQPL